MLKRVYYTEWSMELEDVLDIICNSNIDVHMDLIEMDMVRIEVYGTLSQALWVAKMIYLC